MPHKIDGFELKFTYRGSWKAARMLKGKTLDTMPVTWTKGYKLDKETRKASQEIWYQDINEMEARRIDPNPFFVVLAEAKDFEVHPHEFKEFRAIFEVVATGERLSGNSIQSTVIRRVIHRKDE